MVRRSSFLRCLPGGLLLAAAIIACGTSDTTEPVAPPPPPPPSPPAEPVAVRLVITQPVMTIEIGIVSSFFVLALDANNRSVTRPPMQWTSGNPAVATVSDGFVTGVGEGVAIITVSAGALSTTATVNVRRAIPSVIRLSSSELILGIGDAERILTEVYNNSGRVLSVGVQWTSENPAIASVSDSGVVIGTGVGTTKIVATSETVRAEADVLVGGPNFQAQWASAARASSQYEAGSWSATQAVGQLNVLTCDDESKAWASASVGVEWLELDYSQPVRPTEIRIYEVWRPGSIVNVEVRDVSGKYHQVYAATPQPVGNCLRTLRIPVTNVQELISTVRITVDQTAASDWNEIDAVRLIGYRQPF